MNRLPSIALCVPLFCACAATPPPAAAGPSAGCHNALPVVTVHGIRGVVLPSNVARRGLALRRKDVEGYFIPSEDDVETVEASLGDALKTRLAEATSEPPSPSRDEDVAALTHIVAHLGEYLRQYAGIIVDGEKRILVNAFPDDTYCYRDELIVVDDGGPWFWTIQYDLKLNQFLHWELPSRKSKAAAST